MAYVGFSDAGYKYFDQSNYELFSEDKEHIKLFDYISADIYPISDLLEQYCSARMDMDTFMLISESQNDEESLNKIKAILAAAHPYYGYDVDKIIFKAIGEYFNDLLIYSIYKCKNTVLSSVVDKDWYSKRLWELKPTQLDIQDHDIGPDDFWNEYEKIKKLWELKLTQLDIQDHDIELDDFWNEYQKQIGDWNIDPAYEIEETFVVDVPRVKPRPFAYEIITQKVIANMLYFILDVDAEKIKELSEQQRVWLYANIFDSSTNAIDRLSLHEQLLFFKKTDNSEQDNSEKENSEKENSEQENSEQDNSEKENSEQDSSEQDNSEQGNSEQENSEKGNSGQENSEHYNSEQDKKDQESREIFFDLHQKLRTINLANNGLPTDVQEQFSSAIDLGMKIKPFKLYEIYEIHNLRQLLFLEVLRMIQKEIKIKKCKNCGKYFIRKRKNNVYCQRILKSGRKCSEAGPNNYYKSNLDEPGRIYNRAYTKNFARVKNGLTSQSAFCEWCDEAKDKEEKVRNGEMDIKDFEEFCKKRI